MSAEGLQDVVDTLAARLGRSVAIDDPTFHLIVSSRHFGDEDPLRVHSILNRSVPDEARDSVLVHGVAEWGAAGRVPGNERFGYSERVCVPVRHDGELLGYLWLIDPTATLTADEVAAAADSAATAGALVKERQERPGDEQVRADQLARAFVFGGTVERAEATRRLWFPEREEPRLVVVAAETGGEDAQCRLRAAFRAAARNFPCTRVLPYVDDGAGFALLSHKAGSRDIDPRAYGSRMCAELGSDGGPGGFRVGVSGILTGWHRAPELHRQAGEALDVGRRRGKEMLAWEDLGVDPLLARLAGDGQPPVWPGAALVRQLLGDRGSRKGGQDKQGMVLLESAEAYLDHAADVRKAAARIHVHRTTLYYRLRRIEELTGLDLADGDDRLTLHVALRLYRLGHFRQ